MSSLNRANPQGVVIEQHVKEYLARGGKIKIYPMGATGLVAHGLTKKDHSETQRRRKGR